MATGFRLVGIVSAICIMAIGGRNSEARAASPVATTTAMTMASGSSPIASGAAVAPGSEITLTATVDTGSTAVTTGQVNFCYASATRCSDIFLLGTAQITSNGAAVLRFHPGPGSHSYQAVFLGTPNGAADYVSSTSNTLVLTINAALPTTTAITSSGSPGNYTLTATVTGSNNVAAPTGTASFLDTSNGNVALGSANLVAGASALSFINSDNPAVGDLSQSATTADFNGDGIPDAAIANYGDGTVSILLGRGDGTFSQSSDSPEPAGQTPFSIATADFNADGIPDLVFANVYGEYVTVILGRGDGTFVAAPNSPITAGDSFNQPKTVAVGDFNGDGIPDVAIGLTFNVASSPGTLIVLLGKGDGTFTKAASSSVTLGGSPISIAVADFNREGIADLVMANFATSNATVLLGKGDGTFTQAPNSPITVGSAPWSVVTGDFNGDGIFDLAVVNSQYTSSLTGSVTILLGKGDGTFAPSSSNPITVGNDPVAASLGDFNGDGKTDLSIINNGSDSVTILLGGGDGTFTQAAASPLLLYQLAPPIQPGTIQLNDFPQSVAVADFNGDGVSDLIVANAAPSYSNVLLSKLTQTATAVATGISPLGTGAHLVEASYPGDKIWASSTSGTVALTAQKATPTLSVSPSPSSIGISQSVVVAIAVSGAKSAVAPMGAVTLTSGNYSSAVTTLSSGTANINIPANSLPVGSDTLNVQYSGDANYAQVAGAATITVSAPVSAGFKISGSAVSIAPGATTGNTSAITITPAGGFTGSVTLTASITGSPAAAGLPPVLSLGATSPVNLTGTTPGSAVLTISTTASSSGTCSSANSEGPNLPWKTGGGVVLACVMLFGIRGRRRPRIILAISILFLGVAGGITGCGGTSNGKNTCNNAATAGTAAGSYTITITGTSGGTTATQTIVLTVQ